MSVEQGNFSWGRRWRRRRKDPEANRQAREEMLEGVEPLTFTPRTEEEAELYLGEWGSRPWDEGETPRTEVEELESREEDGLLAWAELGLLKRGPCPYESHRDSDWLNAGGRRVCGICHPPMRPAIPADGVIDYTRDEP
jgi:hypothetical protein